MDRWGITLRRIHEKNSFLQEVKQRIQATPACPLTIKAPASSAQSIPYSHLPCTQTPPCRYGFCHHDHVQRDGFVIEPRMAAWSAGRTKATANWMIAAFVFLLG
jgi:hypothetical protein